MSIFKKRGTQISRDGGVIGIAFEYQPLRDPRTQPINTLDLMPSPDFKVNASDEFYAKFHSIVVNNRIEVSVFSTWKQIEESFLEEYPYTDLGDTENARYLRAAMTGFLMAVCEDDAFQTFRKGKMASYLFGAMLIYIRDIESATSIESQKMLLTGLLSGYHKAHSIHATN
jgi:hypothetical protein